MSNKTKSTNLIKRSQTKIGVVVRVSGSKTISVKVSTRKPHPQFKKVITITKSFLVHDANEQARVGDNVKIILCRPISALKRWRLDSLITG